MAILHQAQLKPSKLELLQTYLPTVAGVDVGAGTDLQILGAYRFDDPDGEVGIESHLIKTPDGRTIHVPVTYRASPLPDGESWLAGTLEHSALGKRWVYNACGDPVYGLELLRTILTGGSEVKLEVLTDDGVIERERTVLVSGSGNPDATLPEMAYGGAEREGSDSVITVGPMRIAVHHVLDAAQQPGPRGLTGTWPGAADPVALATIISTD